MEVRMNRTIRWRISFKTIKERKAMVYIYEDGYAGDVIDLEGAEKPISTEEDSSEELLYPVRSHTGYLRVIDNGDLAGLMPSDNMQHYVELYIDSILEWCGYMQAATFTQAWDTPPIEVEYPLISGIGVLGGLFLDEKKSFSDITLAAMLKECFDMSRINYDFVYMPAYPTQPSTSKPALNILSCSRFNFFEESNAERDDKDYKPLDSWKAMDVVSEILKFFGWSLYEKGRTLYIVEHGCNEYRKVQYQDFGISDGQLLSASEIQLSSLDFDGDNHTRDILQGYKKLKITASFKPVGDIVPQLDPEALGRKGCMKVTYTYEGQPVRYEQLKLFGGGSKTADTEMRQLFWSSDFGFLYATFKEREFYHRIGAVNAESDLYDISELPEKKNYNYKSALIFTLRDDTKRRIPMAEAENYTFMIMRNKRSARYSSGAFVFRINRSEAVMKLWGKFMKREPRAFDFFLTMRVGSHYWDGSQWTTQFCKFKVPVSANGKVQDTKTLEMPYNNAEGYIMPITQTLSGEVELTIYGLDNYRWDDEIDRIYIEGLKVEYFPDDNEVEDKNRQENKYQSIVDNVFTNDMEVNLKLATYNKNGAGYGLLTSGDNYIQELSYSTGELLRPEYYLLGKLKRIYTRNIEKLSLAIELTDNQPINAVVHDKKKYTVTCRKINWVDEHEEITLMDVQ